MYNIFMGRGFFWVTPDLEIGDTGVVQSVAPGGGGPGGFPGIFPGGGVSNSGWAGYQEFQERMKKCLESGKCPVTYGPSPVWFA